jgi:hypothetical protein
MALVVVRARGIKARKEGEGQMIRTVASKVMWVGRATVFLVGLAVILALVLGVAVSALAGTGVGATFNLGKTNTVNALSRLEGSTLNSMLKIDQNGSGTALNLEVQNPTLKPPMLVNSSTKVDNLNSDLLDGKDSSDFMPFKTYTNSPAATTGTCFSGTECLTEAFCDGGDKIISGGFGDVDAGTTIEVSTPEDFHQGWFVQWKNDGTADSVSAQAYCADLGTPHTP